MAKYIVREAAPTPLTAVLLVVDMQEHFRKIAAPILGPITRTIETCRQAGIPVVFTQHRHHGPKDEGMLREWWGQDLVMAGTHAAELLPEVGRQPGEKLVQKHTYSAFQDTDLKEWLNTNGKSEVIITGVMTNLCCETTARDAFIKGFRVFFSSDATATANSELHVATLKNMAYGFAYLVNAESLQRCLCNRTR